MDENKKQKLLLSMLIVLIVVLLGLFYVIYNQIQNARESVSTDEEVSVTAVATKTLQNVSVSYDLGSPSAAEDLDSAKDVVNRFMLAKENRSLDEAKPFMSEELFNSTTPEEFAPEGGPFGAGTSSPSMDRFEIISAEASSQNDTFEIVVKSYWILQGEEADQIEYRLTISKSNNEFLVNVFNQTNSTM
ncbi:MAG: hypothetical protein ABIJ72_04300 [bacterium]